MSCVPGLNKVSDVVTSTMENVAREAAEKVTSMIPDLTLGPHKIGLSSEPHSESLRLRSAME